MSIKEELNQLRTNDTYSLILFVLYKLRNVPEYSGVSELAYVLDESNFLNLCEYFGGLTITIPTVKEIKDIVDALLLYQYVDIDGVEYNEAIESIGFDSSQLRHVKKIYRNIKEIIKEYNLNARG
jgi:hypothetical protein